MRAFRLAGVVAAGALLLAACGSGTSSSGGTAATWADVDHLTYVSTAVTVDGKAKELASPTPISIAFGSADISAQAGCNTMNGAAALTDGVLVVEQLASTRMACEPALMDQDTWLSTFLTSKPAATMKDQVLTLAGSGTEITMSIKETVGFADSPLGGPESEALVIALCEKLVADKASEAEAQQAAEQNGFMFRVLARDGEEFPATMDYRPDRVNIRVEGGIVTSCTAG